VDQLHPRNNKSNLTQFKTCFVASEIVYTELVNKGRTINENTIDIFVDHNDPDWLVKYRVEELAPKKIFELVFVHLN
jgi:hypothetical protein